MRTAKTLPPIFTCCTRLLLILILSSCAAWAGDIRGRVTDESGAVIPKAEIRLQTSNGTQSTFTDSSGEFKLTTSARSGTLTASAQGFSAMTLPWHESDMEVSLTLRPADVAQTIVVTAERTATPIAETAANVVVLNATELNDRAAITLDEALRQVPGFTLFRRNNSLSANPTTQGASVRGVGASGASRVLVLEDGIPLNDPFGGWVYWDRTPRITIDRAEVLRGGGSTNYGSGALGGVVDLITRQPSDLVMVQAAGDTLSGHDVEGLLSHKIEQWTFSVRGETLGNDGAFIVLPQDRGLVDTPTELKFSNGAVQVERSLGQNASFFGRGSIFAEQRNNGTLLQVNSTHLGELAGGMDAELEKNVFTLRVYGTGEHYHQSFSAIATDRNSEALTRWQTVPSDQAGFSAEWSRPLRAAQVTAGVDGRFIHGESDETVFASGSPINMIAAGGRNNLMGTFAEVQVPLLRRLRASAGLRVDWWSNQDGFTRSTPLSTGLTTSITLSGHNESALSPRAGLIYELTSSWQITASAYGGFRAPTLNELYRTFRLGNVITQANEALTAEHLQGGETGLRFVRKRFIASGEFFQENVDDPVGNVTLSVTPALITRQRQNMGALRARGADADLLLILPRVQVRAGYEYVHSVVTSFSANPVLVGRFVPEVPAHVFTASAVYAAPRRWSVVALLRAASRQFDDDLNHFELQPYSTLGLSLEKQTGPATWFASASNIFDCAIQSAATPVFTYASPRIVSGGVRLTLNPR
ncbi:MAG TPA: TonB-dependent receptor [Candidatus Angelobacter sp.]|nr:TonB-dependent receptor [Candidatus Angelobacter sp.]